MLLLAAVLLMTNLGNISHLDDATSVRVRHKPQKFTGNYVNPPLTEAIHEIPKLKDELKIDGLAISYRKGVLKILDQQKLPSHVEWIEINNPNEVVEAINTLKVRGSQLTGMTALLSIAQLVERGNSESEIQDAALLYKEIFSNNSFIKDYMDAVLESPEAITNTVMRICNEELSLCQDLGKKGAALIQAGENILTNSNTGGLGSSGIGTALGVIKTAHQQGKRIHVYVCEARPMLRGGRLTAWELEQYGIPYTVICDNMVATLMRKGKIDRIVVGGDKIAANGDFANKIGTYGLSILAYYHQIPFHVVARDRCVDLTCLVGNDISIEECVAKEMGGVVFGSQGSSTCWAPLEGSDYKPEFDITPRELVTSYILSENLFK